MYAAIRHYTLQKDSTPELIQRVEKEFLPHIRAIDGFRQYHLVATGKDSLATISLFDTKEGAEASGREATAWVTNNMKGIATPDPGATVGEVAVTAQKEAQPGFIDITGVPIRDTSRAVRELYEAFNARDLDRGARHLAPDAPQTSGGEVFYGPNGYRALMQRWLTAFPDGKAEVVSIVAGDEAATVEYIGRGTHNGPLATPRGEIPATGRRVELRMCDVLHLRDTSVTRVDTYYDSGELMRQLGLAQAAVNA